MTESVVEDRAAALLRRDDAPVPLARLYRDVVRDLGPVLSGPAQLHACLRERPGRFLVLDPPGDTAHAAAWPEEARRAYASALEHTAFSPEPRIALAPSADAGDDAAATPLARHDHLAAAAGPDADAAGGVLRRVDASIRSLAGAADADPTLPAVLAAALAEAAALRRALSPEPADRAVSEPESAPDEPPAAPDDHAV